MIHANPVRSKDIAFVVDQTHPCAHSSFTRRRIPPLSNPQRVNHASNISREGPVLCTDDVKWPKGTGLRVELKDDDDDDDAQSWVA